MRLIGIALFAPNKRQTALNSESGVSHDAVDNYGDDPNNPLLQILFFRISAPKTGDPPAHRAATLLAPPRVWARPLRLDSLAVVTAPMPLRGAARGTIFRCYLARDKKERESCKARGLESI